MEEVKQEIKTLMSIDELKAKYGEELVGSKVAELEKQVGSKIEELDERLFMKIEEPETPNQEEVIQILALMTELYLAEGRVLKLIELQRSKKSKHIPHQFRQRLNNLFVNNRVLMDYFHKKFNWKDIEYQNILANSIESMTNLFIACKQEDREHCIKEFKSFLETKYLTNGSNNSTTETND